MSSEHSVVRLGVVGCGAACAHLYAKPLARLRREGSAEVVFACDPSTGRREWARQQWKRAATFARLEEALTRVPCDGLLVISPPAAHAEHAILALNHGINVLCEKPLSDAVGPGQSIVAAASRSEALAAVEMPRRFQPNLAAVREWLISVAPSPTIAYEYREGGNYTWPIVSPSAFRRSQSGGGVLQDKGVHVLDLLSWIFGKGSVNDCQDDAWRDGVEANSLLEVDHAGVRGLIQLSWSQELQNGLRIWGRDWEVYVPVGDVRTYFVRRGRSRWERMVSEVRWFASAKTLKARLTTPRNAYAGIERQLIYFVRAVRFGEPVVVSVKEALETLQLLDGAYERAVPLKQDWLGEAEGLEQIARHWRRQGPA